MEITLDAGGCDGGDADWRLLAASPFGWFHYELYGQGWTPGFTLSHRGPLFDVGPKMVLNRPLPAGSHSFYFGVEAVINGNPGPERRVFDVVHAVVK